MAKIILISGATRSGKSTFAEKLALHSNKPVAYLATAQALDEEMTARIINHQNRRSEVNFRTFEEPYFVRDLLLKHHHEYQIWLMDCLTLYISNLLFAQLGSTNINNQFVCSEVENKIMLQITELLDTISELDITFLTVTNEVGWGLVPPDPVSRTYRDLIGKVNQQFATVADEVYLTVMGIPLKVK